MDYVDVCLAVWSLQGCKVLWKTNKPNSVKSLARTHEETVKMGNVFRTSVATLKPIKTPRYHPSLCAFLTTKRLRQLPPDYSWIFTARLHPMQEDMMSAIPSFDPQDAGVWFCPLTVAFPVRWERGCDSQWSGQLLLHRSGVSVLLLWVFTLQLYITRDNQKGKSTFCQTTEIIKTSLHFTRDRGQACYFRSPARLVI